MKIASKVLLILELIGLIIFCLVQAALGGICVLGTWYAKDIETYNLCYSMSYILLINLLWYILPLIFTIYGLCKVSHHKDGNHYLLAGILTAIFAGLIPGILMIVDASDEKVEEAEDALIDEIYGHDDCCFNHDEECECEECHDLKEHEECECHHEHKEEKECKKHHWFSKKEKVHEEQIEEVPVVEEIHEDLKVEEEKEEPKTESFTSGNVDIEVISNKEE